MWREGWRIEGVEGKGHYTAECGGRAADRARQERKVREVKRGEARRGEAAQMSKLVFKWARREDGVQGQGGQGCVRCSGNHEEEIILLGRAEGKSGTNKF